MKLIFKYELYNTKYSKKYIKHCESFTIWKNVPTKVNLKNYQEIILKYNILNEVFLSEYLFDMDLRLANYVLKNLKDKDVNYCDIGSQGYDVELYNDEVTISYIIYEDGDDIAYINRDVMIYAVGKWKSFLEREFDDPNYHEIIDTEDIYK